MKTLKYITFILITLTATSCLEMGLDDIETYNDTEITNFNFEYRWIGMNGTNERLKVISLTTTNTIDSLTSTITCNIEVPDTSADFTAEERALVTQSNIVGYADISIAASLEPINDSPELGVISDFTAENMSYLVTGGDGKATQTWILKINSFTK